MTSEPASATSASKRPLLAPPDGASGGRKSVLWNERELRAGWRLLIYFVFFFAFAAGEFALVLQLHLLPITRTNITPSAILVQKVIVLIAAVASAMLMGVLEGRPFGIYGLPSAQAFRARFWQGILWGLAMITAVILLIRVLGGFSFGLVALHGQAIWTGAALWAFVFLCVGFFEEFFFRGYTQFTLSTGIGFWPAAALISAAFGGSHLLNKGEDSAGALSVFVIAMFFCLTLRRTGDLWFAVGLHASFDWGETYLFSVPNSGIVAPNHLLDSSFHGPVWLTGGTVGPEGSVMAFVVVGIAAVIFDRMYRPRPES